MIGPVFFAARHRYEENHRQAAQLNVRRALMQAPLNKEEPGIAILLLGRPILVLPPDAALRLAKEIADQLTEIRSEH